MSDGVNSSPPTACSSSDDTDKKVEQLVARELRLLKKEKEAQARQVEMDRKTKAIEDTELRLGTLAQREQQLELGNANHQAVLKEIKKQQRQVKEGEAAVQERETKCTEREEAVTARERDVSLREHQTTETRAALSKRESEVQAQSTQLAQEANQLRTLREELNAKAEQLSNLERVVKRGEQNLKEDEAVVAADRANLEQREAQVEKNNQLIILRQTALTTREVQFQSDRESLNRRNAATVEREEAIAKEWEAMLVKKEEAQQLTNGSLEKAQLAQEQLRNARAQQEEADRRMAESRDMAGQIAEQEKKLSDWRTELRGVEHSLHQREKKMESRAKDCEIRDAQVAAKRRELEKLDAELQSKLEILSRDTEALHEAQAALAEAQATQEAEAASLTASEESLKRRQHVLNLKEKELLDWMREMTWREQMLEQREERGEPIPMRTATTAVDGGTISSSATGAGGGGGVGQGRSERSPSLRTGVNDDALSRSKHATAHAKCLVDLQLRQLKDQYISAHMKWVSSPVTSTSSTPNVSKNQKMKQAIKDAAQQRRKSLPMFGIATVQRRGTDADTAHATRLEYLCGEVHRLHLQFVRAFATIRQQLLDRTATSSSSPSPTAEVGAELEWLSDESRQILSMTANLEYFLHPHEMLYQQCLSLCPLDRKDEYPDVRQLVDGLSTWWSQMRLSLQGGLEQLYQDRMAFLTQGLSLLQSAPEPPAAGAARRWESSLFVSSRHNGGGGEAEGGTATIIPANASPALTVRAESPNSNSPQRHLDPPAPRERPKELRRASVVANMMVRRPSSAASSSSFLAQSSPPPPLRNEQVVAPVAGAAIFFASRSTKGAASSATTGNNEFSASAHVRPSTAQSVSAARSGVPLANNAARGPFETLEEGPAWCLMNTGRCASANSSLRRKKSVPLILEVAARNPQAYYRNQQPSTGNDLSDHGHSHKTQHNNNNNSGSFSESTSVVKTSTTPVKQPVVEQKDEGEGGGGGGGLQQQQESLLVKSPSLLVCYEAPVARTPGGRYA